jgi:malate synthase
MKEVRISLPDDLARDAAEAGLLDTDAMQTVLRDCLRQRAVAGIRASWAASDDLTDEANEAELVDLVRQVRTRRRLEQTSPRM